MKRTWNWKFWLFAVLAAAWAGFIFARSLRTAGESSAESGALLALLQVVFPRLTVHAVRKIAHFTEFFVLGALLFAVCRFAAKPRFWPVPLLGVLTAAADEGIQRFVPGRSCELRDILIDTAGVLAAFGLLLLLRFLFRRRHKTS